MNRMELLLMSTDFREELSFLYENPRALIRLCDLGGYLFERTPSKNILDWGVECRRLQDWNLTNQVDNIHLHSRPCSLTSLGKKILEYLDGLGVLKDIYENCNLINKDLFERDINSIITKYNKKPQQLPNLWFLGDFSNIGSTIERKTSKGPITIKLMEIKEDIQEFFLIKIEISCPKCKNKYIFEYKANEYIYDHRKESICPVCFLRKSFSINCDYFHFFK